MHLFRVLTLLTALLTILCNSTGMAAQTTTVRRAAFEIGSAHIKCVIADVDRTTGEVVSTLEKLSEKVDFAEDLNRSYDCNLSQEIMTRGLEALEKIKRIAVELKTQEYSAAGGVIFRSARNGRAYFIRIEQEIGIPCRIISEQQAAMLSYHAVRHAAELDDKQLLLWDIGGASMQMAIRCKNGGLSFYLNPIASVSFKNLVVEQIQKKDPNVVFSPNPISHDQVAQAISYAHSHAEVSVSQKLRDQIGQPDVFVAGIGGVHYYAVPEMLGGREEVYTRDQVEKAVAQWTNREDEDFDSDYASTRLTNLILVLGYMDALGIDEVHPIRVNQADGLLAAPEFW